MLMVLSFIFGIISSNVLTKLVIVPCFADFTDVSTTEFLTVQWFLVFPFTLGFYLFFQALFNPTKLKTASLIGFIFPIYHTGISMAVSMSNKHDYGLFWFNFFGSIVTSALTIPIIFMVMEELELQKLKKQRRKSLQAKPTESTMRFYANEQLTQRVHKLTQQLNQTKSLFSHIEDFHTLEKMERHLAESQKIFMNIDEESKEDAEKILEEIITSIEQDVLSLKKEHKQTQLQALEKILLQRQQG